MSSLSILFLVIIRLRLLYSHHIFVTSTCSSYSHWIPLFHISYELLSRQHEDYFLTFMVSETCHHWVENAMNGSNPNNYQIIYSPSEPKTNLTEYENLNLLSLMNKALKRMVSISLPSYSVLRAIFSNTNPQDFVVEYAKYNLLSDPTDIDEMNYLLNYNLVNVSNDILSLKLNTRIDLLLTESFSILAILISDKAFNIPVIAWTATMFQMIESPFYKNLNEPLYLISDELDTVFKSYKERWMNVISKMFVHGMSKYIGYFILTPITKELFFDFTDIYSNTVLIHCLGPPFAPIIYHRPSWRPFGFLLVNNTVDYVNNEYRELYEWIDQYQAKSIPVILISMGSTFGMHSSSKLREMYDILIEYSNNGELFGCIMSIKQDINDGKGNDKLETDFFKIVGWFPQFDLLRHENVKLFINHGGLNGVQEALFSKTLQIILPGSGDHSFNAKRVQILKCGLTLHAMKELRSHIDTLLFNTTTSNMYMKECVIKHEMLKQLGNIQEAADLVEFGANYGLKHLFYTDGYSKDLIPWYQKTVIDVILVFVVICWISIYCSIICCKKILKCCCKTQIKVKKKRE